MINLFECLNIIYDIFSSAVTVTNTELWLVLSVFMSGQDFPISDHGHGYILTCYCFPKF